MITASAYRRYAVSNILFHYFICTDPTAIDQGLSSVGAMLVGPLGKADASGKGDELQSKVIDNWIDTIWPHLAQVLIQAPPSEEALSTMQQESIALCRKINPDFLPAPPTKHVDIKLVLLALLGAILAAASYLLQTK